jgi:signal peptidase II
MRHRLFPFLIAVIVVALDRLTKGIVKAHISAFDSITVIPGLLNIVHTENPGIAFGMLSNASGVWRDVLLIGFSAVVLVAIATMLLRPGGSRNTLLRADNALLRADNALLRADNALLRAGLGFILGGAFGNLYDRIVNGTVTDFVEAHAGQHYFPAFNVADSAITVGACLLLLDMWWAKERRVSHVPEVNIDR